MYLPENHVVLVVLVLGLIQQVDVYTQVYNELPWVCNKMVLEGQDLRLDHDPYRSTLLHLRNEHEHHTEIQNLHRTVLPEKAKTKR